MSQGKSKDVLAKILNELVDYTKIHFATEEKILEQNKYPKLASHKQEHVNLTNQFLALKHDFENGKVTISIEVLTFLKDWLKNHILGVDQQYSDLLVANGVK